MAQMSSGAALRQVKQARAMLKKARQLMTQTRDNPELIPKVVDACWESLAQSHKLMAEIPATAADEAVMTEQLATQRYATSLLVRLRRLKRHGDFGDDNEMDNGE